MLPNGEKTLESPLGPFLRAILSAKTAESARPSPRDEAPASQLDGAPRRSGTDVDSNPAAASFDILPGGFRDLNALMIRVPRTGSASISKALFPGDPGHVTIRAYEAKCSPEQLSGLFRFGFVRNPYSRLVSAFEYLRAGGDGNVYDRHMRDLLAGWDFREFVKVWLPEHHQKHIHFRPQVYWLADENGQVAMDYVGRYEFFQHDFLHVCDMLEAERRALPRINSSSAEDWRGRYDAATAERVAEIYANDFQAFEYKPEIPQ